MEIKSLIIKKTKDNKPFIYIEYLSKSDMTCNICLFERDIKGAIVNSIKRSVERKEKKNG